MPFPFEVPFAEIESDLDTYVDEIFSCLQSEFLTLPKGPGFVEYPAFESGYEALKRTTGNFRNLSIDRKIRMEPATPLRNRSGVTGERIRALVTTACQILTEGAPEEPEEVIHRLNKADTSSGLASLQPLADLGVPYAMLLCNCSAS